MLCSWKYTLYIFWERLDAYSNFLVYVRCGLLGCFSAPERCQVISVLMAFSTYQGHYCQSAVGKVQVVTKLENFIGFISLVIPCRNVRSTWITPWLNFFSLCCKLLNKPKVTTWGLNNLRASTHRFLLV